MAHGQVLCPMACPNCHVLCPVLWHAWRPVECRLECRGRGCWVPQGNPRTVMHHSVTLHFNLEPRAPNFNRDKGQQCTQHERAQPLCRTTSRGASRQVASRCDVPRAYAAGHGWGRTCMFSRSPQTLRVIRALHFELAFARNNSPMGGARVVGGGRQSLQEGRWLLSNAPMFSRRKWGVEHATGHRTRHRM